MQKGSTAYKLVEWFIEWMIYKPAERMAIHLTSTSIVTSLTLSNFWYLILSSVAPMCAACSRLSCIVHVSTSMWVQVMALKFADANLEVRMKCQVWTWPSLAAVVAPPTRNVYRVTSATPAVKRAQSGLLAFNVDNKKFFQQQQLLQQQHPYSN